MIVRKTPPDLSCANRTRRRLPLLSSTTFAASILFVALILLACNDTSFGVAAAECHADSDCAPAICCGSTACLPVSQAEDCSKTSCQAPCKPFTVDCGGQCTCSPQKRCAAVLNTIEGGKCTSKMKRKGDCWW